MRWMSLLNVVSLLHLTAISTGSASAIRLSGQQRTRVFKVRNGVGKTPLLQRELGYPDEQIVLADCVNADGTKSSQMAYFRFVRQDFPDNTVNVDTEPGKTRAWEGTTTKIQWKDSDMTFSANIPAVVGENEFAGTGVTNQGMELTCWKRYKKNLYNSDGLFCSGKYSCNHDPKSETKPTAVYEAPKVTAQANAAPEDDPGIRPVPMPSERPPAESSSTPKSTPAADTSSITSPKATAKPKETLEPEKSDPNSHSPKTEASLTSDSSSAARTPESSTSSSTTTTASGNHPSASDLPSNKGTNIKAAGPEKIDSGKRSSSSGLSKEAIIGIAIGIPSLIATLVGSWYARKQHNGRKRSRILKEANKVPVQQHLLSPSSGPTPELENID